MITLFSKFKKMVAPLQLWLLSQGRCVGCGKDLKSGVSNKKDTVNALVTCSCERVYVLNTTDQTYRRALLNEIA